MKRIAILAVVLVLTLGLAPFAYAAAPVPQMLDRVDIGTASDGVVSPDDWGPIEPTTHGGNWGGIGSESPPGTCRVVWHAAGDLSGEYATLTLDTSGQGFARHIKMRVLDGIADDSFNVYVMNPGGDWVLVYSYADQTSTETWIVHDIYGFPAGKGQGNAINIKIEATGAAWSGFSTYGQMAVDWVEVWGF